MTTLKKMLSTLVLLLATSACLPSPGAARSCAPTPEDQLGPFYKPNAPLRQSVGSGYVLRGVVRSTLDCAPLGWARIEFWLAGPGGRYDDAHRATVFSGMTGAYRFESDAPPPYGGRPPHIHIRVTAPGFAPLITQHYPERGEREALFDLVLLPAR